MASMNGQDWFGADAFLRNTGCRPQFIAHIRSRRTELLGHILTDFVNHCVLFDCPWCNPSRSHKLDIDLVSPYRTFRVAIEN